MDYTLAVYKSPQYEKLVGDQWPPRGFTPILKYD